MSTTIKRLIELHDLQQQRSSSGRLIRSLIEAHDEKNQHLYDLVHQAEEFPHTSGETTPKSAGLPTLPITTSIPSAAVGGKDVDTSCSDSLREDSLAVGDRKMLLIAYKQEAKSHGIKINDEMIAKAANPGWNDRTPVKRWKADDPRCTDADDAKIRRVLREKPHLLQK